MISIMKFYLDYMSCVEASALKRMHVFFHVLICDVGARVGHRSTYGYATEYKKSVHEKCILNSWYFRGYGPRYGMLFRLFSAILCYSPLFAAILRPECLVDFLFKVFLIFGSVPVASSTCIYPDTRYSMDLVRAQSTYTLQITIFGTRPL